MGTRSRVDKLDSEILDAMGELITTLIRLSVPRPSARLYGLARRVGATL